MQLLADGGPWDHPHLRPCLQQVGHAQSLSGKFALERNIAMIVMNSDYHNCLEGHKSLVLSLSLMLSLSLPFVSDM